MKLAIETCFLHDQYYRRGIGRYGREMVARMLQHALQSDQQLEIHILSFTDLPNVLKLLELPEIDQTKLLNSTPRPGLSLHFHSLGEARLSKPQINILLFLRKIRPLVKLIKPDVYFAPHFERGLPSDLVPTFAVAHDAIPLVNKQFSKQGRVINFLKGRFFQYMWDNLLDCKAVFTSSNTSKHDLIKFGELTEEQIEVVYLGISDVFLNADSLTIADADSEVVKNVLNNNLPFLVYDAGFEANKNSDQLLKIFALIKQRIPQLQLVVTGGDFDTNGEALNTRSKEFMQLAEKLDLTINVVPVGRVSEEELALLVKNAFAYINMSGYEGFGFGPLQAMAAGTVAIISNNPCFVEISGEGALVVDPNNVQAAANSALTLLQDEAARNDLIAQGKKYAQGFTWAQTFEETWGRMSRSV